MHNSLAADIDFLDDGAAGALGKTPHNAFAKCRVALGLPKDEAFTAKITPIDRYSCTKGMAVRKHHKQALIPKRSNGAVDRLGGIGDERQIKLSFANERNVVRRRRALKHLNCYPRMPRRVDLNELPQKASPDRRLNANAQPPGPASTCFRRHSRRKLKGRKCLASVLDESRSCVRDRQATMAPLEQRYPEGILERDNAATHRGLPNPQLSRSTPEAQVVSDAQRPADRYRVNRG
jgi:hypothetical protein